MLAEYHALLRSKNYSSTIATNFLEMAVIKFQLMKNLNYWLLQAAFLDIWKKYTQS